MCTCNPRNKVRLKDLKLSEKESLRIIIDNEARAVLFLTMKLETDIIKKNSFELSANKFMRVNSAYAFQHLLGVNPLRFNYHINKPIYFKFTIPKKKNGVRVIQAPNEELKQIQKSLNYYLQALYYRVKPDCVHGFIKMPQAETVKRTIVSNGRVHAGSKFLLNLDIKDFFPSITAKQVKTALMQKPFNLNDEVSTLIALLGTYEKVLPTGSPSSPVLANMVCYEMDIEFENLCQKYNIRYTRYADDLSFSSETFIQKEVIGSLNHIIGKYGFELNESKIRLQSSKSKQTVTGIVVNQKVNVDRKYIRNLRAILHHWELNGLGKAAAKHFGSAKLNSISFIRKLKGQIEFVGQVRGKDDLIYQKLKIKLETNIVNSN